MLKVPALGPVMFPARVRDSEDALRPSCAKAWAVPAQLLDTFHGTAPELVMTAGAIG